MKTHLHTAIKTAIALVFIYSAQPAMAQLNGTYTIDDSKPASASNYRNFTSAVDDLNGVTRLDVGPQNGPGVSGNVTFNVVPSQKYPEYPLTITYTNPGNYNIVFQNADTPGVNNPIFSGTAGSGTMDACVKIVGGSYYTFNGIDFRNNSNNTTPGMAMEIGVYLDGVDASTGCQHNTVMNDTITLDKTDVNATTDVYSVSNATTMAQTNSANTFTNVTVQNALGGYAFYGNGALPDSGNSINTNGGRSVVTNIGESATTNGNFSNGIYYIGQNYFTVANTNINNITYYNSSSAIIGTVAGIYADATSTTPTGIINITNDTIEQLSVASASPGSAQVCGVYLSSTSTTTNISNCLMTDFTSLSTANIFGINMQATFFGFTPTTVNISGNTFSHFNDSLASGDIYGFNDGPIGSQYYNTINIYNNKFYDFACNPAATTQIFGVQLSSQALAFYNNSMNLFTGGSGSGLGSGIYGLYLVSPTGSLTQFHDDTLSNFTSSSSVTGLEDDVVAGPLSLYNCVLNNFSTTGTGQVGLTGLGIYASSPDTIYDNHIYSFSNPASQGQISALQVTAAPGAGSPSYIYNNMIYGLQASNSTVSTGGGSVVGIELPDVTTTGATIGVYYNTVFLNGDAAVDGHYSSALLVRASADAVANAYDIRNNILVNDYGVANANDHAVAIWYNNLNSTFRGLATTTNNNLLYAGTPSAKNLIFYCKGSDSVQTLFAYKTLLGSGKESASVTENPPFMSTAAPMNLNINTAIYTRAESGGQVITSPAINTDINGNIRAGSAGYTGCGTAPDIGADEFCGIPDTALSLTGPDSVIANDSLYIFSISPIRDATGYSWSLPTNATITSGANTDSITVSFLGVVTGNTISVYATNCCGNGVSFTRNLTIFSPEGIHVLPANNTISLFPNPTNSIITLNINSSVTNVGDWSLRLTDMLGQTIYTRNSLNYINNIDLSTLAGGVYFITVNTKEGSRVFKAMKE